MNIWLSMGSIGLRGGGYQLEWRVWVRVRQRARGGGEGERGNMSLCTERQWLLDGFLQVVGGDTWQTCKRLMREGNERISWSRSPQECE